MSEKKNDPRQNGKERNEHYSGFTIKGKPADLDDLIDYINNEFEMAMAGTHPNQWIPDPPPADHLLRVTPANEAMQKGLSRTPAKMLWKGMFTERQLGILFADTAMRKTWLANQIGYAVASGERLGIVEPGMQGRVLVLDAELEEDEWARRYTNETGTVDWPEDFYRVSLEEWPPERPEDQSELDEILEEIEDLIREFRPKLLIIDNISFLSSNLEEAKLAGPFMRRLKTLKRRHKCTILVIAHTPKVPATDPAHINQLAGSKMVGNFLDFCFTLKRTLNGTDQIYLKQLKARNMEMRYESPVLLLNWKVENGMGYFTHGGTAREHILLRTPAGEQGVIAEEDKERIIDIYRELGYNKRATLDHSEVISMRDAEGGELTRRDRERVIDDYRQSEAYFAEREEQELELRRKVTDLLGQGKTEREVAEALSITRHKVRKIAKSK